MVTITKLPRSEIEVSGEVAAEDLEAAWRKALAEAQVKAEMPGFRKGQVPADLVLREAGEDRILYRAAEIALGTAWPEILKENNIPAIGMPEMRVLKLARGNPLAWKARVGVLPAIELPDYKEIARQMKIDAPGASIEGEQAEEDFRKEKEKQRFALLEKISAETKMEIPPALAEAEKIKMIGELRAGLEGMGLKWEDYLAHIKKNEKEIVEGFGSEAEKRARFGLVLREIAKREQIDPTPDEVQERIRRMLPAYSVEEQAKLDKDRLTAYTYGVIRNEKVFALLESIK